MRVLAELLADRVAIAVEELVLDAVLEPPDPREAAQIASAVAERRHEHAAGRQCARRALARLGITGFSLLDAPDRAPIWPASIVGSITHTGRGAAGYCAAAVARAADFDAIGIDAEDASPLAPDVLALVTTPEEQTALAALAPDARALAGKIVFSAKESFYKAQYPATRRMLDFGEVSVELDLGARAFTCSGVGRRWPGVFAATDALVVTAIAIARSPREPAAGSAS